uniref:Uncharacterized protein n=1 Tax=Oryza glumipatula TaxID=40148 RepID=A0A0E0B9W5_9ORYZ
MPTANGGELDDASKNKKVEHLLANPTVVISFPETIGVDGGGSASGDGFKAVDAYEAISLSWPNQCMHAHLQGSRMLTEGCPYTDEAWTTTANRGTLRRRRKTA